MDNGKSFRTVALTLGMLCVLAAFSPGDAVASREVVATRDENVSILKGVLSYFGQEYAPDGPLVKVLEIGGGDPAMNGVQIYIAIEYAGEAYLWDTGLNVQIINKIRFAPGNKILLGVKQDFMDANSSIYSRDLTYGARFYVEDDTLKEKLTVEEVK